MRRPRIVMLTSSFPWGPGEEFIMPELAHWATRDVEFTIMPWRTGTELRQIPHNLSVDTRLADVSKNLNRAALRQTISPSMWLEWAQSVSAGVRSPGGLWRALVPAAAAHLTSKALRSFSQDHGPIDVAYSYWFDYQTLGALRSRSVVASVVSRAHGYDIFEERSVDGRNPFRRHMASRIDLLAPISAAGLDYLRQRYGVPKSTSKVFRLGVPATPSLSPIPQDTKPLKVLSVSSLTSVKRVDLLIETLTELAHQHTIEWSHAGDGALADELRHQAETILPRNVKATWLGQLNRQELNDVLSQPWHLLINTSSSEGVPVSVMEAMEKGIPVAATEVGGTAELVAPAEGLLLNPDESPQQWAQAIARMLPRTLDASYRQTLREHVHREWNEAVNQSAFVDEVISLAARNAAPSGR